MRSGWLAAGLVVAGIGMAAAQGTGTAPTPPAVSANPIAQRKDEMKANQRHLEAIKAVLDSRGDIASIVPRAAEMQSYFVGLPALFPPGTETGDTKALASVWSDRAGFERASATAAEAAGNLRRAAASGDAAATATAFQAMGASCGGCHRNFRGR
ncbi:cytochrome c [Roseomonas sp. BN140053]|uniref:cytochrome c n=1 Tax=Roseomonas sp. BN140053 TaxID=3391898 RepID=UPI0039E9A854